MDKISKLYIAKNDQLIQTYEENWKEIVDFYESESRFSNPLLIEISEIYLRQKTKLFIIGQQTNTWYLGFNISPNTNSIHRLICKYVWFNYGSDYHKVFWNTVREFEKAFKIDKTAVCWSNICRFDKNGKYMGWGNFTRFSEHGELLKKEIELATPDIVLFLTGPRYDEEIKHLFADVVFFEIKNFKSNELVQLRILGLPQKTFRTYHPGYINRKGKEFKKKLINSITQKLT